MKNKLIKKIITKNKSTAFIAILGVFVVTGNVKAEIIFEDNFDNSPDWQSQQTVNKSQPGGYDISWGMTRADICTTHCPPQGWTSYRTASSLWTDNRGKDTFILSSEGARGASGKGITYNVEVSGDYGTWTGGSLDIWLGETGYKELYIRFYLKYGQNWKWTNEQNSEHCQQKLIRISTFNDNVWISSSSPQQYQSVGLNRPVFYPDWYYNKSFPPDAILTVLSMSAPDYSEESKDEYPDVTWPTDGEWHCYEFHVKMNSVAGVADGIWEVYIDGILKKRRTNVMWKKVGSNTDHDWNWLMFLDNITNGSAPKDSHTEMQIYMDDVVVSTEYIGLADQTKFIILSPPTFK